MNPVDVDRLLPHSGDMCLLDTVRQCQPDSIHVCSRDFSDCDHPLAEAGRLSAIALMEYGAQAAGAHIALTSERMSSTAVPAGVVASMQHIKGLDTDLSARPPALDIVAEKRAANGRSFVYDVSVYSADQCLVTGRITLVQTTAETVYDSG